MMRAVVRAVFSLSLIIKVLGAPSSLQGVNLQVGELQQDEDNKLQHVPNVEEQLLQLRKEQEERDLISWEKSREESDGKTEEPSSGYADAQTDLDEELFEARPLDVPLHVDVADESELLDELLRLEQQRYRATTIDYTEEVTLPFDLNAAGPDDEDDESERHSGDRSSWPEVDKNIQEQGVKKELIVEKSQPEVVKRLGQKEQDSSEDEDTLEDAPEDEKQSSSTASSTTDDDDDDDGSEDSDYDEDSAEDDDDSTDDDEEDEDTTSAVVSPATTTSSPIFEAEKHHLVALKSLISKKREPHNISQEAEFEGANHLDRIRELEKRANIPQKIVDAVDPKADEDLLELMVKIAENPTEWQQIHHILQQVDDDVVTAHKTIQEIKKLGEIGNENQTTTEGTRKKTDKEKKKKKKKKVKDGKKEKEERNNSTEPREKNPEGKKGRKKQKDNKNGKDKNRTSNFEKESKARRKEMEKAGIHVFSDVEDNDAPLLESQKSSGGRKEPEVVSGVLKSNWDNSWPMSFEDIQRPNTWPGSVYSRYHNGPVPLSPLDRAIAELSSAGSSSRNAENSSSRMGGSANMITSASNQYWGSPYKQKGANKQWPHFAYHRVTTSPLVVGSGNVSGKLGRQRGGAGKHRSAYIAVSVISPPKGSKLSNSIPPVTQSKQAPRRLPDKMDTFTRYQNLMDDQKHEQNTPGRDQNKKAPGANSLPMTNSSRGTEDVDKTQVLQAGDSFAALRSAVSQQEDQKPRMTSLSKQLLRDPLEEELVDEVVKNQVPNMNWSHTRHQEKLQEQLKKMSAMEEKLKHHWLEKDKLYKILRDGGKGATPRQRRTTPTQSSTIETSQKKGL